MPFRLGSSTPKPSQAIRSPSGDHAPPQKVSSFGSGGGSARKSPVVVSTKWATIPSSQQKIWISVPSGDHRGPSEGPSKNSCSSPLPSGFTVYVTLSPSSGSPRTNTILPLGSADS